MDTITFISEPNHNGFITIHWVTADGGFEFASTRFAEQVKVNQRGTVITKKSADFKGKYHNYFSYLKKA